MSSFRVLLGAYFLFAGSIRSVVSESIEELFAAINNEGFPLELLIEAADIESTESRHLTDLNLVDILELPVVRKTAQKVALYYAAKHLLNSSGTSRALLMFNWADRKLCKYQWLSWLPWLQCQRQEEQWFRMYEESIATYSDEALPPGECYSDAKE